MILWVKTLGRGLQNRLVFVPHRTIWLTHVSTFSWVGLEGQDGLTLKAGSLRTFPHRSLSMLCLILQAFFFHAG